ncbi:MAG: hypothetical protein QNJ41_14300 [Xenococcaceae cyanobacterium MO_188.B32]|nr:hypothetical protein [Xenococcaceae cyanobacterium MO_188.B32]
MPVVERSCFWLGFHSNRGSGDHAVPGYARSLDSLRQLAYIFH